ncbi:MAG: ATP:cob(I)alamin adenosyltransferase, partial [Sulfolobaceae archaeon]
MKWYTGKGDEGFTSLPQIGDIWKDDIIIEAIGDLDELNSVLGILSSLFPQLKEVIEKIQSDIFSIS